MLNSEKYTEAQDKFNKGEISFDDYSAFITNWTLEFSDILKSNSDTVDPSKGGDLVQKKGFDKKGNKTTKWVKRGELNDDTDDSSSTEKEFQYNISKWKDSASNASEKALNNASKYAKSEEIRSIARNELFRRDFNPKKFMDMSLFPLDMVIDYVNRYTNENITDNENKSINSYIDTHHKVLNEKLRNNGEFNDEEMKVIEDLTNSINKSILKNDVILHRGVNGSNATMLINYLKSRKVGDIYEEKSFTSATLIEGKAIKLEDLYKSTNNLILKIYTSKGQSALSMQNLGSSDNKTINKDGFEFLLAQNSKFQVIEMEDNVISVKLI